MKILITGGTGLVGTKLTEMLYNEGHQVNWLTRKTFKHPRAKVYKWDINQSYIDPEALEDLDVVIHLAGAGVADRKWSQARKKELTDSRVFALQLLKQKINRVGNPPKLLISASGINYYGEDSGETWVDETSRQGGGFLAYLCEQWETVADEFKDDTRVVKLRIGVVLDKTGGALKKMVPPIKYLIGAPLGSGKQYISWIHIEDLCQMINFIVNNDQLSGVFNAVSNEPETNADFTRIIAKTIHRPLFLPNVPAFVLSAMYGQLASIIIGGNRVSNQKIRDSGFEFKYPDAASALKDVIG